MVTPSLGRRHLMCAILMLLCLAQTAPTPVAYGVEASLGSPDAPHAPPEPGDPWGWGYNLWGQLGDGSTADRSTPVQLPLPTGVVALSGGYYHTLALQNGGRVYAWGRNADGQLGIGSSDGDPHPYAAEVPGLSTVTAIAAGAFHSLALRSDGSVWAWGWNDTGQLGDGTTTTRLSPVQVLPPGSGVVAIAAGYGHSLALKSDGTVLAWGYNAEGQLGDGTTSQHETPLPVLGLADVTAIGAGWFHSLAVKDDGAAWAWGMGIYGQLGVGSQADSAIPLQVAGLTGVSGIAAGHFHSLAVTSDQALWAWGNNNQGQLGDGTVGDGTAPNIRTTPYHVAGFPAGVAVTAAAGGWGHTLALLEDGSAWSWGLNQAGQLGTGAAPQDRVTAETPAEHRALGDQATWGHALSVRRDMASPTSTSEFYRATPAQIPALSRVALVAAGYYHSLAMVPNPRPAWDVNGDHIADIADIALIGLHWQESGTPGWIPEDANGDGVIDVGDIAVVGLHWLEIW